MTLSFERKTRGLLTKCYEFNTNELQPRESAQSNTRYSCGTQVLTMSKNQWQGQTLGRGHAKIPKYSFS